MTNEFLVRSQRKQPVTDEHELAWEDILEEMEKDQMQRRMPSMTAAEFAYRLEDIRS